MNKNLFKLLLVLLVCIPMTSTDIFVPLLPNMTHALNTDTSTISLTLSSYMIGFSLSMLASGGLSDLYGRKIVLMITLSLYTLTCLLIVFCANVYLLIGLRFLQGIGGGSGTVISRLILKDSFKDSEQVAMASVLSTGMALAPAIAPQIGVWSSQLLGWHGAFLITFMLGLFVLWIVVFKLKETNQNFSTYNPIKNLPQSFFKVFNSRKFIGFALLIGFAWCAYFNFIGLSSFLFQKVYLFSENQYAFVIAIVTVGYVLGTTFARILNKRHVDLYLIIKIGAVISLAGGIGLLGAYLLQMPIFLILSMLIVRLGIGLIMPTSQVGAMRICTKNTGWAMGCLFFMEFILGSATIFFASLVESNVIGLGMMISILMSILILIYATNLIKEKTI